MRKDIDRLHDILDAIEAITRHIQGGRESFDRDELIRVWCLRHLEVIGEAAARMSEAFCSRCQNIPWREIIGMRNTLVHGYFDIDWDQVWNAVENDLPVLRREIEAILKAEE
ncbi:MAG: HepT-like ribonuclease domain-containing protein [Thermodesulfobacteriota bacterium]